MTGDEALLGGAARGPVPPHPRGPERWRIEITGMGNPAVQVRVALVDAETGRMVGAREVPFTWLRDVAHGSAMLVQIQPGEWT